MGSTPHEGGSAIDPIGETVPTPPEQSAGTGSETSTFRPAAGLVLAEKFRLECLLGKGGMGEVWAAEHLVLKSPVAIKLIHTRAHDEVAAGRFLREAQSAASLRSRNVVQILDYGVDQDTPYIVMELLEGESLAQRLRGGGPLDLETTISILADVCRAVGRAHEAEIVHRDLKPDNIFLVKDGDAELAKVLDFGIAKAPTDLIDTNDRASTQTGALLGTPYYMSPEQAKNSKRADHRSDLWAIGVIGYECVVGERPFASEQVTELVLQICTDDLPIPSEKAQVPPGFDAWFARVCSRDLDRRYQTAQEVIAGLREIIGASSASTIAPGLPAKRSTSVLPWVAGLGGLGAIVAIVALGGPTDDTPEQAPAMEEPATKAVPDAAPSAPPEPTPEPEPAPEPAPAGPVTVTLQGAPAGAEVFLGDEALGPADQPFTVPHSDKTAVLRVVARGYQEGSVAIVPTSDLSVPVTLTKKTRTRTKRPAAKPEKKPEVTF